MKVPKADTAKERVAAEAAALKQKIEKLDIVLADAQFMSSLDKPMQALLVAQSKSMTEYYNCLVARLSIWRD